MINIIDKYMKNRNLLVKHLRMLFKDDIIDTIMDEDLEFGFIVNSNISTDKIEDMLYVIAFHKLDKKESTFVMLYGKKHLRREDSYYIVYIKRCIMNRNEMWVELYPYEITLARSFTEWNSKRDSLFTLENEEDINNILGEY